MLGGLFCTLSVLRNILKGAKVECSRVVWLFGDLVEMNRLAELRILEEANSISASFVIPGFTAHTGSSHRRNEVFRHRP